MEIVYNIRLKAQGWWEPMGLMGSRMEDPRVAGAEASRVVYVLVGVILGSPCLLVMDFNKIGCIKLVHNVV